VLKLAHKLQAAHPGLTLKFCYEAGPRGFALGRCLRSHGLDCILVCPSKVPRKPGERVKTDRRDADDLARLYRAGELTGIYVPEPEDEAMRDLIRARFQVGKAQHRARQQLKMYLLRHNLRYGGQSSWTPAHLRYLAKIKMPFPVQQIVFQEMLDVISEATARLERYDQEIERPVPGWRWAPAVRALMSLRGMALLQGQRAKTDPIDAAVLSEYGTLFKPVATAPASPQQQQLAELAQCRRQLIHLLVSERNHAEHYTDSFRVRQSRQLVKALEKQITQCDEAITTLIAQDTELARKAERLKAISNVPAARMHLYYWPLEKRERNQAGRPGKLHMKCAIVDNVALIGSANLTDDAFNRNMELGILIREQTTIESISEHFQELIRAKVLVPVMQVETNRR
jgi:transposase